MVKWQTSPARTRPGFISTVGDIFYQGTFPLLRDRYLSFVVVVVGTASLVGCSVETPGSCVWICVRAMECQSCVKTTCSSPYRSRLTNEASFLYTAE